MTNEFETPSERQGLCRAIKFIAWGYILLYLDINLFGFNILPEWLGFLLILYALPPLAEEVPSIGLLRPLAILLAAWDILKWIMTLTSTTSAILSVIAAVAGLYFHFQLLTDLSTLAEKYRCPQTVPLLRLRTVNTLIATAFSLPMPWENAEWLAYLTLAVYLIVVIWICAVLFGLKRDLSQETVEDSHTPE